MTEPTIEQLAEQCMTWIRGRRGTSFVELSNWLDAQGIEARGDWAVEIEECPNLFLWANMSQQFVDLVAAIKPLTELQPLSDLEMFIVYGSDGGALSWPTAKRPPKNGYKTPRWAPAVLNAVS